MDFDALRLPSGTFNIAHVRKVEESAGVITFTYANGDMDTFTNADEVAALSWFFRTKVSDLLLVHQQSGQA